MIKLTPDISRGALDKRHCRIILGRSIATYQEILSFTWVYKMVSLPRQQPSTFRETTKYENSI
jgi:hypothetical protein